jgi:hypothetical protein
MNWLSNLAAKIWSKIKIPFVSSDKKELFVEPDQMYASFECPISFEIPNDPVFSPSGTMYEKEELSEAIRHKSADPYSNIGMLKDDIVTVPALSQLIKEVKKQRDLFKKELEIEAGYATGNRIREFEAFIAKKKQELEQLQKQHREAENTQKEKLRQPYVQLCSHFYCPISMKLPENPVLLPSGRVYDQCSLMQWIKQCQVQQTHATEPHTDNIITESDLYISAKLTQVIEEVKQDIKAINFSQVYSKKAKLHFEYFKPNMEKTKTKFETIKKKHKEANIQFMKEYKMDKKNSTHLLYWHDKNARYLGIGGTKIEAEGKSYYVPRGVARIMDLYDSYEPKSNTQLIDEIIHINQSRRWWLFPFRASETQEVYDIDSKKEFYKKVTR